MRRIGSGAAALGVLIVALACGPAPAQTSGNGGGKGCLFHPRRGDPVPVANGEIYTPRVQGRGGSAIAHKWQCRNGRLVVIG